MFNRLPPELVRQIIESSVPSTFHSTTYDERQFTLRSLCLVSRLFRQLAQPLLFETNWSYSPESLDAALEALGSEQGGKVARHLLLTHQANCIYLPDRFDKLMQHPDAICTLVLQVVAADAFDLALLQSLPNLASLQLSGGGYEVSSPLVLVKLHSLNLYLDALEVVSSLLNPDRLPAVRNLALLNVYEYEDALKLQTHRFFDLLPHLTTFYSDWELAKTASHLWRDYLENILFHSYGFDLPDFTNLPLAVRHLQVYDLFGSGNGDSAALEVRQFVDWIKSGKAPSFRSIYLDADLQESEKLPRKKASLLKELQVACKERNIEIISEEQPNDPHVDSAASAEFCRRQETFRKIV